MGITLNYMGQLKNAVGTGSEELDLGPCSLVELIAELSRRHGESFRKLVCTPDGKPQSSILVCIGEEQVPVNESTVVQDGDDVTVLTPISGG